MGFFLFLIGHCFNYFLVWQARISAELFDGKELVFLFVEAFFDFFEVQASLGVGFACNALYIFGIDANSGCFHGG
jgi:hypothetical protein